MTIEKELQLRSRALRVRERIVQTTAEGGCFIGSALSCTDLLVYLYGEVLRTTPEMRNDARRDYFFFSKGHAVPALYGTLAECGYFPPSMLDRHLQETSSIYWHPHRAIPGVEFHAGSLGHLPSVALGVAYDARSSGGGNRIFVLLGDGELNEGSVWESVLLASAYALDNLTFIIDRNKFQANARTDDIVPLEPLENKFDAFGWACRRIDGHDFHAMEDAFRRPSPFPGKPYLVIADTVRGKGIPGIESRSDRWFMSLSRNEMAVLLEELRASHPSLTPAEPVGKR